jgi:hypothetical protein
MPSNHARAAGLLAESAVRTLTTGADTHSPVQNLSMVLIMANAREWLEVAVLALQVAAVATLLASWLLPMTRLAAYCRVGFVVAMVGLGLAGALCAWYGSHFALFAGGAVTIFLSIAVLSQAPADVSRLGDARAVMDSRLSL